MNRTDRPATDRQLGFIKDLLHSRQITDAQAARCRARLADGSFTTKLASKSIDWFLAQPKIVVGPTQLEMNLDDAMMNAMTQDAERVQDELAAQVEMENELDGFVVDGVIRLPVSEIGIYELGDKIYKVKRSKTGNLYAEALIYTLGEALRLTAAGTVIKAKYRYEPGGIFKISAADRVTGDRAKELSIVFTSCIVCGAKLKAAKSVERAIGPVCWKRV